MNKTKEIQNVRSQLEAKNPVSIFFHLAGLFVLVGLFVAPLMGHNKFKTARYEAESLAYQALEINASQYSASESVLVKSHESGGLPRVLSISSDPWGRPYQYFIIEKGRIIVWSNGPNGVEDSQFTQQIEPARAGELRSLASVVAKNPLDGESSFASSLQGRSIEFRGDDVGFELKASAGL